MTNPPITSNLFLTACNAEEACEVAEAASQVSQLASKLAQSILKGVRFGPDDVYQGISNWDRVQQELRELIAVSEALGMDITPCPDKMARVNHWLEYAKRRGIVNDESPATAAHWKANHDNVVAKLRLFTQRNDLPVDRLPAYEYVLRLERELAELRGTVTAKEST